MGSRNWSEVQRHINEPQREEKTRMSIKQATYSGFVHKWTCCPTFGANQEAELFAASWRVVRRKEMLWRSRKQSRVALHSRRAELPSRELQSYETLHLHSVDSLETCFDSAKSKQGDARDVSLVTNNEPSDSLFTSGNRSLRFASPFCASSGLSPTFVVYSNGRRAFASSDMTKQSRSVRGNAKTMKQSVLRTPAMHDSALIRSDSSERRPFLRSAR